MKRNIVVAAALVVAAGCGSAGQIGGVRFKNELPVWRVNDRVHTPKEPADRPFSHLLYFFDAFFFNQVQEALSIEAPRPALNTNSLDEVPDSTWFTNRIGIRDLTAAEVARGPNRGGGAQLPFTIKGTKVGGKSIGFIMKDARGDKYVLKPDEEGYPVIETAADVVVQRIMWALGYNVPEDSITYFTREQLKIADDAEVKDVFGNARKMTTRDLEERLALVEKGRDGRYRALTSKFLPGKPIGGFAQRGVREDDPNDLIPHEHRREVRALYIIYSWLQATDVKEDNSLDIYATDPADENIKYVVHYLVDFGKSLGANATIPGYAPDGHAARVDIKVSAKALFTFGLYKRPWEGTFEPHIAGVGRMDIDHLSPDGYNPQQPYRAFEFVDRADGFWAAKLVMRMSPEHLRAAVEQGRYEDPRAVDYLVSVLVGRQKKLARYWFGRVSPLDRFVLENSGDRYRLCFEDLMVVYDLDRMRTARSSWRAASYDFDGRPTGWSQMAAPAADGRGTACVAGFDLGKSHDDYTVVRFAAERHGKRLPPVDLHLARDPGSHKLRIIGLVRH